MASSKTSLTGILMLCNEMRLCELYSLYIVIYTGKMPDSKTSDTTVEKLDCSKGAISQVYMKYSISVIKEFYE